MAVLKLKGARRAAALIAGVAAFLSAGGRNAAEELPPAPLPQEQRPVPPKAPLQEDDLRRIVRETIWQINMTALVCECLRLRNDGDERDKLLAELARHDATLKQALSDLAKRGAKVSLADYFAPGDQIVMFMEQDLSKLKPGEAANVIGRWIANWRAGPEIGRVLVARGSANLPLTLSFPEATKALVALTRRTDLVVPGDLVALPASLLKEINDGFGALHPNYRKWMSSQERARFETLLQNRKGSSDDVEWMKSRIVKQILAAFRKDVDTIGAWKDNLEPKLPDYLPCDVLVTTSGAKVEGKVIEQTAEQVKLKVLDSVLRYDIDKVKEIQKGKATALEFPSLLDTALKVEKPAEQLEKLSLLMDWCTGMGRRFHKQYVAARILLLDPAHEQARIALGLHSPLAAPTK